MLLLSSSVFQDRSEKRVIEIRIRSRIQSLFILATYTRWPYRGSLGLKITSGRIVL